jgi:LuxR family transcriptional regulator
MRLADCKTVFAGIAPAGFYVALRLGFLSPEEEMNTFSAEWIDHYTSRGLALHDPLMRWVYSNTGTARWSSVQCEDLMGVLAFYAAWNMRFGAVVCISATEARPRRTFGYFARTDREMSQIELQELEARLRSLHFHDPNQHERLTRAQCEALKMLSQGKRLKQIAQELDISESAVKARLKSAMISMDARTPAQAATIASNRGLLR